MTHPSTIDVSALFQHSDFLKSLAIGLIADEHGAEDAVQATWVAALEAPPGTVASAKAWLARVVTNFALKSAGREREQQARERRAARPEAIGDPETDFELHGQVAAALQSLPEPYRSTLHSRYYRGLTPREIAAHERLSVDTVKSRLRRGLEMLRSDLDARFGNRDAWCVALTALANSPATPLGLASVKLGTSASILNGLLAMKFVTLACITLIAATLVTLSVERLRARDIDLPARADSVTVASATAPTQLAETPKTSAARAAVPSPPGQMTQNASSSQRSATLSVVDSNDRPVPDVRVIGIAEQSVLTDTAGTCKFEIPNATAGEATLTLIADGFMTNHVNVEYGSESDVQLGTVRIFRGGVISGHVLDASQQGVADAVVSLARLGEEIRAGDPGEIDAGWSGALPRTRTDRFGAFELVGVRPGTLRVWATSAGLTRASSKTIDVSPGERTSDVRIHLRASARKDEITGRVRLPLDAPDARLAVWHTHLSREGERCDSVPVDEDGRFRIQIEERVPHNVWAQELPTGWDRKRHVYTGARELAGYRPTMALDVPPGTSDLLLSFEDSREIEVEVSNPDGERIDPVELGVVTFAGEDLRQELPRYRSVVHPIEIDVPATNFYLSVAAAGHERKWLGPYDPFGVPDELLVELRPIPDTTGHVTANGSPVEGATVELFELASRQHKTTDRGFLLRTQPTVSASSVTDADGKYHLTVRKAGRYVIRADAKGWAGAEIGPFTLDPHTARTDLDIPLASGGAIEGRVLLPEGDLAAGLFVGASSGDIYGQVATLGSDGRFRFEGLTPGDYWVGRLSGLNEPSSKSSSREPVEWSGNCTVASDETTYFELDLRDAQRVELRGLWSADTLESGAWTARLRPGTLKTADDFEDVDTTTLSAEGEFQLVAPEPGPYLLFLQHEGFPARGVLAVRPLELKRDRIEWSEHLQVAELRASFAPDHPNTPTELEDDGPLVLLIDAEPDGFTATALLPSGGGIYGSTTAPVGSGRIHYRTEETEELPPFAWPAAGEVTVAPDRLNTYP